MRGARPGPTTPTDSASASSPNSLRGPHAGGVAAAAPAALVSAGLVSALPRPRALGDLFDRNGLREVPRLVDVQPAQPGDAVGEKLERDDGERRLQERRR